MSTTTLSSVDTLDTKLMHLGASDRVCYQQMLSLARELEGQLSEARRESAMWKANHDNQVELKGIIASRPDLRDRAPRVEALIEERNLLRAQVKGCTDEIDSFRAALRYEQTHPDGMAAQRDRLYIALQDIASYDRDSRYGEGICPYGCDTPHIARQALQSVVHCPVRKDA